MYRSWSTPSSPILPFLKSVAFIVLECLKGFGSVFVPQDFRGSVSQQERVGNWQDLDDVPKARARSWQVPCINGLLNALGHELQRAIERTA